MPERLTKLHATVEELEKELHDIESVDPQTRSILEEAIGEIQAALRNKQPQDLEDESLMERLKTAAQDFEYSHPTLSGVIGRLIHALGQMGI